MGSFLAIEGGWPANAPRCPDVYSVNVSLVQHGTQIESISVGRSIVLIHVVSHKDQDCSFLVVVKRVAVLR